MAGLSFLASNYIYHVGPLFRQHMFMVMFETLAVVVLAHVTEIEDTRRRRLDHDARLAACCWRRDLPNSLRWRPVSPRSDFCFCATHAAA